MYHKPQLARTLSRIALFILLIACGQMLAACAIFTLEDGPHTGTSIPTPLPTVTFPADAIELPIETIEQFDFWGIGDMEPYDGKDPKIVVLRDLYEVKGFNQVTTQAQEVLQGMDFDKFFAMAVFQGQKPTNMYGVTVLDVHLAGSTIIVSAHFIERDPQKVAADAGTSPYHLIKVARPLMTGSYTFVLVVDGQELQSYSVDL